MLYGAKMLSRTLYVSCRKERVAQIARTNNYLFFTAQNLELLFTVGGEHDLYGWSTLQSAFTAQNLARASAENALIAKHT
jgi:hypothetical protein